MPFEVEFQDAEAGLAVLITPIGPATHDTVALSVILDGAQADTLVHTPDRSHGVVARHVALPSRRISHCIDLIDDRTGRSVLCAPYALAAHYAVTMTQLGLANGGVFGRFTARYLASRLWIEFNCQHRRVAGGFATRDDDDTQAEYAFALPFMAAVPPYEASVLTPTIAGMAFPRARISVSAADVGVVGFVDTGVAGTISGWAIDLRRPDQPVRIDVLCEGGVFASVLANQFRDDLRALGIRDGHAAFVLPLDPSDPWDVPRTVSVVAADSRVELCNSPFTATPASSIRGCLDKLHGLSAHGWAIDDENPSAPVVVEAVCDGRVLASTTAKLFRGDLLDAGLNGGFCAFKLTIGPQLLDLVGRDVYVRVAGTGTTLQGSPAQATHNPNLLRYLRADRDVAAGVLSRLKRMMNHRAGAMRLSIIMPVHNTPQDWLVEALASVRRQWCDNWTLICVDDASTAPHVPAVLAAHAAQDPRIVVRRTRVNVGIAGATNVGLRLAVGDYVTFMDHDDVLEPDAVYHLLQAARETGAGLIYSDEATTEEAIDGILEVRARPSFSYDYYLSHPYVVHMICVRRELAHQVAGWDEAMAISADVDFVLRVLEQTDTVAHVARVLYRWRTHGTSAGHARQAAVMDATAGALQRHLDRRRTGATVRPGVAFNQFRVDWPASAGRVLVVIPTKNHADLLRTAIESVERTTGDVNLRIVVVDHESDEPATRAYLRTVKRRHLVMPYKGAFNYSRMNNLAVQRHGEGCEFVLFLNNDIEAIEPGWLDRMRRLANRSEVGAVGALLLYPDRRVQHAGVILGFNGSADHAFKFEDAYLDDTGRRNLGYNCSLVSVRDFSAVTAACMMMRVRTFLDLGGFDERFGIGFNDTDLCLRVRDHGLKVLYDGNAVLLHHESATRSMTREILHPEDTSRLLGTHAAIIANGDPFYNPNLSMVTQDHVLREDRGCKRPAYRVTRLGGPAERPLDVAALDLAGSQAEAPRARSKAGQHAA